MNAIGKKLVFNHEMPTLSELDKKMISYIPQGGNWQSIPESVPSKRLEQIRKMSKERGVVRTTYYGRLRLDQPAYTISTYYNRPGNGTHIHPIYDRTLTSREAARLQSFPDSYKFSGSAGAVRTQIGNAVPPLLAYSIGIMLEEITTTKKCVDVFCGAGGLSLGLEWAGWNIITAIDNNSSALETYRVNRQNHNSDEVIRADLHNEIELKESLSAITAKLNGDRLDLLVGGPPCQGFSHAGFRNQDDKRNDLAVSYLKFAEELRPKIFMLENVEGLLSMKKGRVIEDLVRSLGELGYFVVSPIWKLNAEEYGVPQMRRRVFLVAVHSESLDLDSPTPLFNPCLGRRKTSRLMRIRDDLPAPINIAEALFGLSYHDSNESRLSYSQFMSGKISLRDFMESARIS